MREVLVAALLGSLTLASPAIAKETVQVSSQFMQKLAPGMARDSERLLDGDIWKRPELSVRDRSLVTVAALVTTGSTGPLRRELERALDNGLTASEIGAALEHLAFYAGWARTQAALPVVDEVFRSRGITPPSRPQPGDLLPLPAADVALKRSVVEQLGPISPRFAELTNNLFDDLWRRPELAPRDRSLITLAALAIIGDPRSLVGHVERGLDFGLTQTEIKEEFIHLAFYAGWDTGTAALWEASQVFAKRNEGGQTQTGQ